MEGGTYVAPHQQLQVSRGKEREKKKKKGRRRKKEDRGKKEEERGKENNRKKNTKEKKRNRKVFRYPLGLLRSQVIVEREILFSTSVLSHSPYCKSTAHNYKQPDENCSYLPPILLPRPLCRRISRALCHIIWIANLDGLDRKVRGGASLHRFCESLECTCVSIMRYLTKKRRH